MAKSSRPKRIADPLHTPKFPKGTGVNTPTQGRCTVIKTWDANRVEVRNQYNRTFTFAENELST
jgi:hypothetical protein